MRWHYVWLCALVCGAFAGGVWVGHTPARGVCEIDLRRDPREAVGRLAEHPAFRKLSDGTLASEKPCRVRLAHDDGTKLDRVFTWVAVVSDEGASDGFPIPLPPRERVGGGSNFPQLSPLSQPLPSRGEGYRNALGLLCRLEEMPVRQAYEEAISLLVALNFDDESVERLEQWYTAARRSPAGGASLELVKASHAPRLTLAVSRSETAERQWRIVLEVEEEDEDWEEDDEDDDWDDDEDEEEDWEAED